MSNIEMKINKMDLVNDMIGYIMTVGPMLMKPEVSVFTIAVATGKKEAISKSSIRNRQRHGIMLGHTTVLLSEA